MDALVEKVSSHISFYDICFVGKYGWFCDVYTNTLYKIDLNTNEITLEEILPIYELVQYGFIANWNNYLVLAPRAAKTILIYDISQKAFMEIDFNNYQMNKANMFNLFSSVQIYGEDAYFIPGRFPAIIKMNLYTFEMEYFDSWYEKLKCKIKNYDDNKVLFARCNCRFRDKLLLPCWQSNIIMEFQFETGKFRFIEFPEIITELSDIYIRNNELFLASKSYNMIFKCNFEGKVLGKQELEEHGISFLVGNHKKILAVPGSGKQIIQYDLNTHECKGILDFIVEKNNGSYLGGEFLNVNILSCVQDKDNNIWMYSIFEDIILKLNIDTGNVERIEAVLSEEDTKKKAFGCIRTIKGICEGEGLFFVRDFCDGIINSNGRHEMKKISTKTAGQCIFKTILRG